jgi:hypothetical protein
MFSPPGQEGRARRPDLAGLLRLGRRLPETWIADRATRGLRELVRYRHHLIGIRTGCNNQTYAVLGKCGVRVERNRPDSSAGVLAGDQSAKGAESA